MPKKGKKGKGKGKKGKGKGKKGPKSGKKSKPGRDIALATALEEAQLYANRFETTEKSRNELRENCKKMASENEKLHDTLYQSEKDTINVVKFLKKDDMAKDEKISSLEDEIRSVKKQSRKDKEEIIRDFNHQIAELEARLEQRNSEVLLMQSELKLVKEFRQKRAQMQTELDDIRESLFYAHKDHKDTMQKLEHKFFEEKLRLEREANYKIAELAERAQVEALSNLEETTRAVYYENIKLNETLSEKIKKAKALHLQNDDLTYEVDDLRGANELNIATIKQKTAESFRRKQEIRNLNEKVTELEKALSSMVMEFREEKLRIELKVSDNTAASDREIKCLQEMLKVQGKEMHQVKTVARKIVKERTAVETFFLDALEKVRTEIALNRRQYVEAARAAYHRKMREAHRGQGEFPKVRTFSKSETSTNSVYEDLREAENWSNLGSKIDIGDLTWEQKEQILRLLFARMNGIKRASRPAIKSAPQINGIASKSFDSTENPLSSGTKNKKEEDPESSTFITQQEPPVAFPSIAT